MPWLLVAVVLGCAGVRAPPPPAPPGVVRDDLGDGLRVEIVVDGPAEGRRSPSPADLVVLHAGEHLGSLQTCGCPRRPRGSLARLAAYDDAVRRADPAVLVHGGRAFDDAGSASDGVLRPDVALGNAWMARALARGDWDALNVGDVDAVALSALPEALRAPLPTVSANLSASSGGSPRPWVVVERGGRRVGITGITGETTSLPPGWTRADPVKAGARAVAELAGKADVVVLLAYRATEAAEAVAAASPGLDVVVDTALHREHLPPVRLGGAVRVGSHYQGMRAGELRLRLDGRHRVVEALDRTIDLDPTMPDEPALAAMQAQARDEVDRAQQQLFGGP
jgi:2',3'-cyclic-nucleotide 2'-phosphodiesterase (5'-nucleotidase family)